MSAAMLAILALMPAASGQQYGESHGALAVTQSLKVSGDGFTALSAVKVQLANPDNGETIDLATLTSDRAGGLAGSIALPDGLVPGTYRLTATGVTPEGATRVLSASVQLPGVSAAPEPVEPVGGTPLWLLVLLPILGLLVGTGAGWWFAVARRTRPAEQPVGDASTEETTEAEGGDRGPG